MPHGAIQHQPHGPRSERAARLAVSRRRSYVPRTEQRRDPGQTVAIVGMGCSKFGENWDKDPQDMIVEAAYEAYADAKLDDPQKQIEAVFCGAQYPSKGTAEVADALKLYDRPVSMVVNYCATGTDAFRYGVFAVACGMYDTVLVVGFDKPKDRGVSGPSVAVTGVRGLPATPAGWFLPLRARYFETYGAGREDLAKIAVKNHHNGTLAPKSMLKREITVDEALKARIISWPFGLYDCAAQSDGAAAAIITRRELAKASATISSSSARSASRSRRIPRRIRASTSSAGSRPRWPRGRSTSRRGSPTPRKEIHVAQVHDCFHPHRAPRVRGPRLLREGLGEGAHFEWHLCPRRRAASEHRRRPEDLRPPHGRHRRPHDLREVAGWRWVAAGF